MRVVFLLITLFLISCNQDQKNNSKGSIDHIDTIQVKKSIINFDSVVLNLTKQILNLIKKKDYENLGNFIHPIIGIRFSPYGYVDTINNIKLRTDEFLASIKNKNMIKWGRYDGSGEDILLTTEAYFNKFVYSADFLNAEKTSLNKMIGSGNSLNNLESIYKDCYFTESYFSGFDKKYAGMDWCSLRLIFKEYKNRFYLVGVVHDQWTI